MKRRIFFLFILIFPLAFSAQYTSMTLKLSFEYTYIGEPVANGDGASGRPEPVFKLFVMPVTPNVPSPGYSAGQCFYQGTFTHRSGGTNDWGWVHPDCGSGSLAHGNPGDINNATNQGFDPVIFNQTFDQSSGFPTSLKIYLEAWENDGCGATCEYNTCLTNSDDLHETEFLANIDFKSWGPPCTWNGGTYTTTWSNYYTSTSNYGVSVKTYYEYNDAINVTHYWLGEYSNNWFDECNWNTKHVPFVTNNVVIPYPLPDNSASQPRVHVGSSAYGQPAGHAFAKSIQIESGAKVTVENGAKLKVNN